MSGPLRLACVLLSFSLVAAAPPPVSEEDVDPNAPEVQACAAFALESFNYFSQDLHLYAIASFYSVKRENIGGGKYVMEVEVRETLCLKGPLADLSSCHALTSSEAKVFRCRFIVLSAPWKRQRFLLESSCTPSGVPP
ncbi:hypothetical protein AAFF_G00132330 [Aldrovandia affinis]|uniref:Cystatin domain-containing protein n=1 Tax=Aldrovandia affinis TaxID=143900 RepID=A0AAD7RQK2_9TELE|nr:hypothetical protein AAFF_G00132330 [Aldrovandia affinis]